MTELMSIAEILLGLNKGERRNMDVSNDLKAQLEALVERLWKCGVSYGESVRQFKKRFIERVLRDNKGNQVRTARELCMHRNTLSRTIAELDIDIRQFTPGRRKPVRHVPAKEPVKQIEWGA